MKQLDIYRWYGPLGTLGTCILTEAQTASATNPAGESKVLFTGFTCERPPNGNEKDTSCIPEGTYFAVLSTFTDSKGNQYKAYELKDVQGRTLVFIHIGNIMLDTDGCILLGLSHACLSTRKSNGENYPGVIDSGIAFNKFMTACNNDDMIIVKIQNYVSIKDLAVKGVVF